MIKKLKLKNLDYILQKKNYEEYNNVLSKINILNNYLK